MPALKVEKSQADRISECMTILRKLTGEIGVDAKNPSVRVLKKRMSVYWRDGKVQEDTLPLFGYNRSIVYKLPKWANQDVEVTLRINNIRPLRERMPPDLIAEIELDDATHQPPPSDPAATPEAQTNSATQSDP